MHRSDLLLNGTSVLSVLPIRSGSHPFCNAIHHSGVLNRNEQVRIEFTSEIDTSRSLMRAVLQKFSHEAWRGLITIETNVFLCRTYLIES